MTYRLATIPHDWHTGIIVRSDPLRSSKVNNVLCRLKADMRLLISDQ